MAQRRNLPELIQYKKKKRRTLINRRQQQLGDVPELIHLIQLALPSKDAARTCILSKSWLHAWSTNPAIRLSPSVDSLQKKRNQTKYIRWIQRTLLRYHPDNLPITCLDLLFGIHSTSLMHSAYKLITEATSKSRSSLNELHLTILSATSFTLPNEIFSSENLHTLSLNLIYNGFFRNPRHSLRISSNPSINCTNLRVLKLLEVHITDHVLHKLLSTCKLLQKIHIEFPLEWRIIEVNNLRFLDELIIYNLCNYDNIFQVDDVPSLCSLVYNTTPRLSSRPVLFKLGIIRSLKELTLDKVSLDDAFSSMIKSNFPFLESLTLRINWCSVEILDIRCLTLRTLTLDLDLDNQIKVQVYAPNLLSYKYASMTLLPSVWFQPIPPQQFDLTLVLDYSIDESFFLEMREALEISSKFSLHIFSNFGVLVPFDLDYLRTILPFPATNVEELVFLKQFDNALWDNSHFFDAVFSICHPMYVKANNEINLKVVDYLLNQLMVKEDEIGKVVVYCEIRDPLNGRWVELTSSSLCWLDTTTLRECSDPLKVTEFKLSWCSP